MVARKEKSKKGKDNLNGMKVNTPEEISAEHSESWRNTRGGPGKEPGDNPQREAGRDTRWMIFRPWREGRRLLNWTWRNSRKKIYWTGTRSMRFSIIKIKGNSRIRPRRTRWCRRRPKNCIYHLLIWKADWPPCGPCLGSWQGRSPVKLHVLQLPANSGSWTTSTSSLLTSSWRLKPGSLSIIIITFIWRWIPCRHALSALQYLKTSWIL